MFLAILAGTNLLRPKRKLQKPFGRWMATWESLSTSPQLLSPTRRHGANPGWSWCKCLGHSSTHRPLRCVRGCPLMIRSPFYSATNRRFLPPPGLASSHPPQSMTQSSTSPWKPQSCPVILMRCVSVYYLASCWTVFHQYSRYSECMIWLMDMNSSPWRHYYRGEKFLWHIHFID